MYDYDQPILKHKYDNERSLIENDPHLLEEHRYLDRL